jgi:gamma-glutamyltranspeptidase/glutathione hydrolase
LTAVRCALRWLRIASAALLLTACAGLGQPPSYPLLGRDAPDFATVPSPGWQFARQAVAAAHPLAAEAGLQVLRAGGSAIDAAVAAQLVLGLVEPQASGLGGGAFLLHWDGRRVQAYDGRETAPAAADESLFLDAGGKPLPLGQAIVGGRSVGVPGALRMLEQAHRVHGRLAWRDLFQPAIELAENGFPISARVAAQIERDPHLRLDATARALFYAPDGRAWPAGSRLRNPDYAAVLRDIAAQGADALHRGPLAERIVAVVQGHASNPGRLAASDLERYAAVERAPLCFDWRRYRVCGFPPPGSGAIAIGQMLALLDSAPGGKAALKRGLPGAELLHAYTESARLAFADRDAYVADPAFVAAPGGRWESLLEPSYLAQRARLIGERSLGRATAGSPAGEPARGSVDVSLEVPATSHLSIVDADGRAVAMTTTIEAQFGSRLMVNSGRGLAGGFLLNNQLTDFSFVASIDGRAVPNRVQPGKRPRSSMSPTLVFERQNMRLVLVTGSPGGAPIIHYTAKTLLGTLAWGLDAQQAVELPNFGSLNGPTLLEAGRFPAQTIEALKARGHDVREQELTSGAHTLLRAAGGWSGGADPRRDGSVVGD